MAEFDHSVDLIRKSAYFYCLLPNLEMESDVRWEPTLRVYCPLKAGSIDGTDTRPHDKAIERAMKAIYKPNKAVQGDPDCTLFIGRLDSSTSEHTLSKIFSKYGDIVHVRVVRDIVTGMSKRYAFIEYSKERYASRARRDANRLAIDGSEILVEYECERILPKWIPRRLGGGFGGKKESGQLRFGGSDRPFRRPIIISKQDDGSGRGGQQDRHSDRYGGGHYDRDRGRHSGSYYDREGDRQGNKSKERDRYYDRHRERDRHRDRNSDRHYDRRKDNERDTGRHRERDSDRNRDRYSGKGGYSEHRDQVPAQEVVIKKEPNTCSRPETSSGLPVTTGNGLQPSIISIKQEKL